MNNVQKEEINAESQLFLALENSYFIFQSSNPLMLELASIWGHTHSPTEAHTGEVCSEIACLIEILL